MGHVIVNYPDDRSVFVDGQEAGVTNQMMMVETGTHVFTLEGDDYLPPSVSKVVAHTTTVSPLIITDFHPV